MPEPLSRLSPAALVRLVLATGAVFAVAGCSQITPLGPGEIQFPPTRHLGSPIILQVMGVQPATATGGCPAGWVGVSLPAGGGPQSATTSVRVGSPHRVTTAATASPAGTSVSPRPLGSVSCYRPGGKPVTITSAAITSVLTFTPPPRQANAPDTYGFMIAVPTADVAAVTAVIKRAYDSKSALGISVAGKLWQAPMPLQPFTGQRLQISLLRRNQAVQLYRLLIPPG